MKALIAQLLQVFGPSGFEDQVRTAIRQHVTPLADEVREDAMGNLAALKRGDSSGRRIMLAAHMDEIGLIVTQIEDSGLLRFSALGTLPRKSLVGARARFANGVVGVLSHDGGPKAELLSGEVPELARWYIDVGVEGRQDLPVGIGDVGVLERPFVDQGARLIAGGFDDRVGCAILIEVLRLLQNTPHEVHFVFTVQEEFGVRGARVAAFGVETRDWHCR